MNRLHAEKTRFIATVDDVYNAHDRFRSGKDRRSGKEDFCTESARRVIPACGELISTGSAPHGEERARRGGVICFAGEKNRFVAPDGWIPSQVPSGCGRAKRLATTENGGYPGG